MKKIVAFGASSSKKSINQQLAVWAVSQMNGVEAEVLDLNDFEMPIYSIDRENENGIPQLAIDFREVIEGADGVLISFAEHNGNYSAAFKNIYDWFSRIERPIWANKPVFLMATSPGGRGGKGVLGIAQNSFPHHGATVTGAFSLPSFGTNFHTENGILDEALEQEFRKQLTEFERSMSVEVV